MISLNKLGHSITKIVRKVKPRKLKHDILIIASSPLCYLLIALGGVIFAGIVTFFSVVIAAWAGEISLIIGSISSLVVTAGNASLGQVGHAIAYFGITLIYIGLALFLFIGAVRLTQFMYELGRKVGLKIKTKMVSRGNCIMKKLKIIALIASISPSAYRLWWRWRLLVLI